MLPWTLSAVRHFQEPGPLRGAGHGGGTHGVAASAENLPSAARRSARTGSAAQPGDSSPLLSHGHGLQSRPGPAQHRNGRACRVRGDLRPTHPRRSRSPLERAACPSRARATGRAPPRSPSPSELRVTAPGSARPRRRAGSVGVTGSACPKPKPSLGASARSVTGEGRALDSEPPAARVLSVRPAASREP